MRRSLKARQHDPLNTPKSMTKARVDHSNSALRSSFTVFNTIILVCKKSASNAKTVRLVCF
jgi:hypothetical protein